MPRVFISYRREDASAYAGRLFDRLSAQYGRERIFMDVDSLEPGADFGEAIEQTVASCDVLIAVIGRQWLDAKDADGARRLDNPEDFVRLELASALTRKIRVVPLLVGNARMPRSDDLPEPLKGLARRNAFEVSDIGFHESVGRLIGALSRVDQAIQPQAPPAAEKEPAPDPPKPFVAPPAQASVRAPASPAPPPPVPVAAPQAPAAMPSPPRAAAAAPIVSPANPVPRGPLWIPLLLHLLFGAGLIGMNSRTKRRFAYPVALVCALFGLSLAQSGDQSTSNFGQIVFVFAAGFYGLGFIDVLSCWLSAKPQS
jgi:TIR domain